MAWSRRVWNRRITWGSSSSLRTLTAGTLAITNPNHLPPRTSWKRIQRRQWVAKKVFQNIIRKQWIVICMLAVMLKTRTTTNRSWFLKATTTTQDYSKSQITNTQLLMNSLTVKVLIVISINHQCKTIKWSTKLNKNMVVTSDRITED